MQSTFACILTFLVTMSFLSAQSAPCDVLSNGIDLQTKSYRIEIAPEQFFNHTPPEIKNELQSGNLIQCSGQIVKMDDEAALHLNLRINSQQAKEVYGSIHQQFILKVILIDGKEVKLNCFAGSQGVLSPDKSGYIYPIGYALPNRALKTLAKKEIDKIGIQWTTGYEEYIIYNVDFLMNQIACLQQASRKKPN